MATRNNTTNVVGGWKENTAHSSLPLSLWWDRATTHERLREELFVLTKAFWACKEVTLSGCEGRSLIWDDSSLVSDRHSVIYPHFHIPLYPCLLPSPTSFSLLLPPSTLLPLQSVLLPLVVTPVVTPTGDPSGDPHG